MHCAFCVTNPAILLPDLYFSPRTQIYLILNDDENGSDVDDSNTMDDSL